MTQFIEHSLEIRTEEETLERNILNAPKEFDRNRERLETEFAEDSKRIIEEIENGDREGSGWYSNELSSLDLFKQSLILYKDSLKILKRAEQRKREYTKKN